MRRLNRGKLIEKILNELKTYTHAKRSYLYSVV